MSAVRDYGVPVLLALGLHALIGAFLTRGWTPESSEPRVLKPRIVNAELIVLQPSKPKPTPPAPRAAPTPKPAPPPEPPPPREREEVKPQPRAEPEAERRRQEAERRERLAQLADRAFEQSLAEEAASLASDAEANAALSYLDGIYRDVVGNWSRPPSARNDMQAELLVELIPTGEVVSVTLVTSSGSPVFDDSAERAVRKARRFAVPRDMSLFEARFRKFTLLFKPEDLLR